MSMAVKAVGNGWKVDDTDPDREVMAWRYNGSPMVLTEAIAQGLLRDVRAERGLTQRQVCDLIGVPEVTYARWERSVVNPLPLYAAALVDWLMGRLEDE